MKIEEIVKPRPRLGRGDARVRAEDLAQPGRGVLELPALDVGGAAPLEFDLARVERALARSTKRSGMPIRSISLNLTPGLPSRSSSKTSTPLGLERLDQGVGRRAHARVVGLVEDHDGAGKGAISAGHRMPSLSWPCSMAAATTRRHADAVAAHDHGLRLLVLVQVLGLHGLRIFRAELESVADLDALEELGLAAAARAGVLERRRRAGRRSPCGRAGRARC